MLNINKICKYALVEDDSGLFIKANIISNEKGDNPNDLENFNFNCWVRMLAENNEQILVDGSELDIFLIT
jgi:hypothetical protein